MIVADRRLVVLNIFETLPLGLVFNEFLYRSLGFVRVSCVPNCAAACWPFGAVSLLVEVEVGVFFFGELQFRMRVRFLRVHWLLQ